MRPIGRQNTEQVLYGQIGMLVGRGGFEPPTSRLSGVRSNQLSYRPISKGLQRTPILKCPIFYRIGVKDIAGIDLDSSVSQKVISAP